MLELDFYKYMGRDHSSPAVESQGHKLRSKVTVKYVRYLLQRPISFD